MKHKNKETIFITYFFFLIFLGMMIYFVYFQVVKSEDFINSPYNSLQNLFADKVERGKIISSDGVVLVESKIDSDGNESRVYPYKNQYAHVVGYAVNGKAGMERQSNFSLLRSHQFILERLKNDLTEDKNIGDNVITTIDHGLQTAAYKALGKYDGAVIALEPSTGKILAMVSQPDFNPNTIEKNWEKVNEAGSTVLFNRATQGQYAPGSVFKIFTLFELYRENPLSLTNYSFDCDGEFSSDGTIIHCAGNEKHGNESLKDAFANSCNASFAEIGLKVDNSKLNELCDSMLFNTDLPIAFPSGKSKFSLKNTDSAALTMETAIGQGKTLVSPLHMAMIAGAVCNEGKLMVPYLVDRVENHKGINVTTTRSKLYREIMTEEESHMLEEYMRAVVEDGTAKKLNTKDYDAFGKTGTAQVSDSSDQTNAWFVGYARSGEKEIAIAVVVENSGYGSKYAVPVAQKVFEEYFK